MFSDLKFAARTLLKSPGFAAVVVITLALGIGANTAIFSVVNSVMLQPLPYPQPQQIVQVTFHAKDWQNNQVTSLIYEYWSEHSRAFAATAATGYLQSGFNLAGGQEARLVPGIRTSSQFLRVLGVLPALGRSFLPNEDRRNGPDVAMISDRLWRNYFGGDADVVGKTAVLNGRSCTIVGVLPPGFYFETPLDVLLPLQQPPADPSDDGTNTRMLARLKPGVTFEQAQAEVAQLWSEFRRRYPAHLNFFKSGGVQIKAYQQVMLGDVAAILWLLFGAVALVLLIACANIANLLLARAVARKVEILIRTALGASRWRVIRQVLAESWLLAALGSLAGLLIAWWSVPVLLELAPPWLPRKEEVGLDYRAVLFAIAVSLATMLFCGLAPAWRATRLNANGALQISGTRASASRADSRMRAVLIVSQVSLSFVLLAGAALLTKSLLALHSVQTGFTTENVITAQLSLATENYATTAKVWAFEQQVLERLAAQPGVQAVAAATSLPLEQGLNDLFEFYGHAGKEQETAQLRAVSPQYFGVLGIPVLRGRTLDESDTLGASTALVVNETLAKHYWPHLDPLGRPISWRGRQWQIVGVTRDVTDVGLNVPTLPTVYIPIAQIPDDLMKQVNSWFMTSWLIRTAAAVDVASILRRAVQEADPQLPLVKIRSLRQVVGASLQFHSFLLLLMGIFAGLALTLTAVGIYGVLSYQVGQRTHELGIRMALGAQARDALTLVIRQSLRWAILGVAIGASAAYALTRLLGSLLYAVSPTDPAVFAVIAALLVSVALLSCYAPARRAIKVDPLVALRAE